MNLARRLLTLVVAPSRRFAVACGGGSGKPLTPEDFCAHEGVGRMLGHAQRCAVDDGRLHDGAQGGLHRRLRDTRPTAPRVFVAGNVGACISKTTAVYKTSPITPDDLDASTTSATTSTRATSRTSRRLHDEVRLQGARATSATRACAPTKIGQGQPSAVHRLRRGLRRGSQYCTMRGRRDEVRRQDPARPDVRRGHALRRHEDAHLLGRQVRHAVVTPGELVRVGRGLPRRRRPTATRTRAASAAPA